MSLTLWRAFGGGARRALTPTGGILLVALFAIQLLVQSSVNSVVDAWLPPGVDVEVGLTLPVSGSTAAGLLLVGLLLNAAFLVVAARALTRPVDELSAIPRDLVTHRLGRATLWALVGGVIVGVSVSIGLVFLVLPGIFLAACFLFHFVAIAVEDRGVLGGLSRSWGLGAGSRLKLSVIVILAGLVGLLLGTIAALGDLAGAPVAGELASNAVGSVLFVPLYGVVASAYLQLRGGESGDR